MLIKFLEMTDEMIWGCLKTSVFGQLPLDLDAMFKIKSLLYKDLILNSSGMFRK